MTASRRSTRVGSTPPVRYDNCQRCGGRIAYYPRRPDDVAPNTKAVNDAQRWAHLDAGDWLASPHRPVPSGETPRPAGVLGTVTGGR